MPGLTGDRNDQAIWRAADGGHLDVLAYLIDCGATIGADNQHALRKAASNGNMDVVRFLLQHGANVDSHGGRQAVKIAQRKGHKNVVDVLNQWFSVEQRY
jgi:ankyrin repeat protein